MMNKNWAWEGVFIDPAINIYKKENVLQVDKDVSAAFWLRNLCL